jgi:hypothetical protein
MDWNDLTLDAAVADAVEADLLDGPATPPETGTPDYDATELDSRYLARAVIHQALRDETAVRIGTIGPE